MATQAEDFSGAFGAEPIIANAGNPATGDTSPTQVFIVRARDLLVFAASWQGLTLEGGDTLVAGPNGGTLTVGFPFQHVGEAARKTDVEPALPPPVLARAARGSRLVFAVPAGTSIGFSVDGLLAAMSSLEPAVAPAASGPARQWGWGPIDAKQGTPLTRLLGDTIRTRLPIAGGGAPHRASPAPQLAGGGGLTQLIAAKQTALAVTRIVAGGGLAAGDLLVPLPGRRPTFTLPQVRAPKPGETAIEAPFRLILSPSSYSGWAHASHPVAPDDDENRVELWHTRLATRRVQGGHTSLDEAPDGQRTLRAIWTRDRERTVAEAPGFPFDPFNASLNAEQRKLIVEQTAGSTRAPRVLPTPIQVRTLALSSLGAFLDAHVQWPWQNYPDGFGPLESWDHVAPMGRDQFVRVVTPGFLHPLGHAAFLVQITYRKMDGTTNPVAGLFQRRFLVLGDPNRPYATRDFPFVSANVAPLRTPDLDPAKIFNDDHFVPFVLGQDKPFEWRITALDQDGRAIHLRMPMVWVRALKGVTQAAVDLDYKLLATVPADGQSVAFAPALSAEEAGDAASAAQAAAEVQSFRFAATISATAAAPRMEQAQVVVPAMKRLTPTATPVPVEYADIYKTQGFGATNGGNVYLKLTTPSQLVFGSSDRSGGFIQPDVTVAGLARGVGMVADLTTAQAGKFDPQKLFGSGFPKLFGLIDLWDIVGSTLLDHAPKFLTDELNKATALLRDVEQLRELAEGQELQNAAGALAGQVKDAAAAVIDRFEDVITGKANARDALHAALTDLQAKLKTLSGEAAKLPIGPLVRATLDRLIAALGTALMIEGKIDEIAAAIEGVLDAIEQMRDNLDPGGRELRARMEWKPVLKNWSLPGMSDPVFVVTDKNGVVTGGLTVAVETRVAVGKPPAADVSAELTKFALMLIPGAELMRVNFDRLAFRMTVGRKPEVDVVFGGIEFLGVLGFVNTLAGLIPLDGFSDPPYVDVSTDGVTAGFTLALPNLAIGVFSLSNLAIAADARVPFLGDTVSVGFSFCTREKPFTLAVAFLGGGGFVGIRLSPNGLMLLEAAFEFGAVVALDFGVASGSVSAMAGIYFRMEGSDASLTGYFRVRGEVDVLSLITASIELYMALTYAFSTGKMVGEATITVSVEVLFFSTSVHIHAERTFAGSNGDPTAREMLLPFVDGRSAYWEDYCAAFAPAKAEG